jgi:ribosomal protein S18 acetylase RimI-like enzyme
VPSLTLADLDQRPDLLAPVLELLVAHGPGRAHAVCGIPPRMGQTPVAADLAACLGTLVLLDGQRVAGALAICPYSDEQATLWGPVTDEAYSLATVGRLLIGEARQALRDGGFESARCLADIRNRALRQFLLGQGLASWKDTHVYERSLAKAPAPGPGTRAMKPRDHAEVATILGEAFPESLHCQPSLATRDREGYRHYLLERDRAVVAAAAVQAAGKRSWLKLIAARPAARRGGGARALLDGVLAGEAALGQREIGLEVLADNPGAIATFERCGFRRSWTATILTGPV